MCLFRNPLQSVLGSVGFLKDKIPKSDESYEDVTAIATGALDMARVVNDISDWVKVSVGQLELKRAPELLQPLLDDVVSSVLSFNYPHLSPIQFVLPFPIQYGIEC